MASQIPASASTITCLCHAITLPGTYLTATHFPIKSEICHCDACRYTSGGLIPTFAELNTKPPDSALSACESYQFTDRCERWFCRSCGSHVFLQHPSDGDRGWFVTSGVIDFEELSEGKERPKDVSRVTANAFVENLLDGGVASLLLRAEYGDGEEVISCYKGFQNRKEGFVPEDVVLKTARRGLDAEPIPEGAMLKVQCHCGGVDLRIERANGTKNPYGVAGPKIPPEQKDYDKYVANFCACRSCRLGVGQSMMGWFYVPHAAIRDGVNGDPVFGQDAFGVSSDGQVQVSGGCGSGKGTKTLKWFKSRNDVMRGFCGKCGACVFYVQIDKDEQGKVKIGDGHGTIDVAAGIVRADSGAMAREWIYWKDDGWVSHREEAVDQEILKGVTKGFAAVGLGQ